MDTSDLTDTVSTFIGVEHFCGEYSTTIETVPSGGILDSFIELCTDDCGNYDSYTLADVSPTGYTFLSSYTLAAQVGFESHTGVLTIEEEFELEITGCETTFDEAPLYPFDGAIIYLIDREDDRYFYMPAFTTTNNADCDYHQYVKTWISYGNSTGNTTVLPDFIEIIVDADDALNVTLLILSGFEDQKIAFTAADFVVNFQGVVDQ